MGPNLLRGIFAQVESAKAFAEEKAQQHGALANPAALGIDMMMQWFWRFVAIALAGLAILGMPLFAIMGAVAIYLWWSSPNDRQQYVRYIAPTVLEDRFAASPLLITIPLFTFAGYLMAESKTPNRLVRASSAALGWMPGGLAVVCIAASAFFTTMTGGSGVTIVAVGGFLYPALVRQGYPKDFSLGLVTSAGAIGLLFPPSPLVMIYSVVAGIDMNAAYLATSIPALGLMLVLAAYAVWVGVKRKVPRTPFDPKELAVSVWGVKWELMAPLLVAFCILSGLMQLDEAAAAAALYFLIVEVYIYRDLNWKQVMKIAKDAIVLAGSLIIILTMATAMSNYIISENVSTKILEWFIKALNVSSTAPELEQWKFVLALNLFLFIVGMLMDGFSTILVGLPLLLPLAAAFQIHPFHLAVMFLLNMELAYIMPPAGLNLFISSFRFNRPVAQVYRVVIPYVILLHVGLVALIVFPSLSTFSMRGDAAKLRDEADKKGAPPVAAWILECVQMDKGNAHPCSAADKYYWGLDGNRKVDGVSKKRPGDATLAVPCLALERHQFWDRQDIADLCRPVLEVANSDEETEPSQPDAVATKDPAAKPTEDKPSSKPDEKKFNQGQLDLLAQMMADSKPSASASASAAPSASAPPSPPP
ncbi:MAG: TRAP transporter large permease subunit [Polyangiaceae bacterium]